MIYIRDPYRQSIDSICLRHHGYDGQYIHYVAGCYMNSTGTYLCDLALHTNKAGQYCIARVRVPGESFVRFLSVPFKVSFVIFVTRSDLRVIAIVSSAVLLGLGLLASSIET